MQNLPQYTTYRSLLEQRQWQGFSETEVIDILRQVLSQLTKLHDLKQAHGSISLDTVAYDASRMYIVLLSGQGNNYPIYLAPEVAISREATPAGDIYALGVFTIALLTGLPPEKLKTNNEWDWEEYCNVSSRFSQILNITLFDSLDFRYVNAGQMLKSIQSILIPSDSISESSSDSTSESSSELGVVNNSIDLSKPLPLPPPITNGLNTVSSDIDKLDFSSTHRPEINELKAVLPNTATYRRTKILTNSHKDLPNSNRTKNISREFLPISLWVSGIIATGIVAFYFYSPTFNRSIAENSIANNASSNANSSVASNTNLAANQTNQVGIESPEERLAKLKKAEEQANKLIGLAKAKYENTGNLTEAKTVLQDIPANSNLRPKADLVLKQWQEDFKKNNDLIAKAEQAIANGSSQQAIEIVKGIPTTPYWQKRSKKILDTAKLQLNRRIESPDPATNAVPNYSTPPDYIPPTTAEPPVNYPEVPETPTYSAPSYSTPPQETQQREAPPPPRPAN